jgi:two-component system, cell cycle response regulator
MPGRVLIVDPVVIHRVLLKSKLSAAYHQVEQADTALEALDLARRNNPDLILINHTLPELDGFNLCRELKNRPSSARIPVVLITATADPEHWERGFDCHTDDIFCQPVNFAAMLARLRSLIRAKFTMDELKLRENTTCDFGFAEPAASFPGPSSSLGTVLLMAKGSAHATDLQHQLEQYLPCRIKTIEPPSTNAHPAADTSTNFADVIVVHQHSGGRNGGLKLLSQLRCSSEMRHAALLYIAQNDGFTTALDALEIGANDFVLEPYEGREFAARIRALLWQKTFADQLRSDVSDQLRLARIDPLTGLYNRRYALNYLDKTLAKAKKSRLPIVAMMLDLDNFKAINDSCGHPVGDQVIVEFANRLRDNLRGIDLISRIGGEEFLVVVPYISRARAGVIAERIRQVVNAVPFDMTVPGSAEKRHLNVTVSIGVAMAENGLSDAKNLMANADAALYASKDQGRNQVTFFSTAA